MKPLFIKGGHMIDPSRQIDEKMNLLCRNGLIDWCGPGTPDSLSENTVTVDAAGLVLCPGLIDFHCHLREPGNEDAETIATGTAAAAKGGFTTVCAMPNTTPPLDSRASLNEVKSLAEAEGKIRVIPAGCVSLGRQGQFLAPMGELAEAGVMGFTDDGNMVASSRLMRLALEYAKTFGLPVIDHCEDINLCPMNGINEGIISNRLGLAGSPAASEEIIVARNIALAAATGGWAHITHVSTAGAVAMIKQARQQGVRVTADVTPHHLTLTEAAVLGYNTSAKVNPPLRTAEDNRALLDTLIDGTIDAIATDHAPHRLIDKQVEFALAASGISGFETALAVLLGLVHEQKIELTTLIEKMTTAPARLLGERCGKLGTLGVGAMADVTIFDPEREWVVEAAGFTSKGKHSPWQGQRLKGRVVATLYQGQIVYQDTERKH